MFYVYFYMHILSCFHLYLSEILNCKCKPEGLPLLALRRIAATPDQAGQILAGRIIVASLKRSTYLAHIFSNLGYESPKICWFRRKPSLKFPAETEYFSRYEQDSLSVPVILLGWSKWKIIRAFAAVLLGFSRTTWVVWSGNQCLKDMSFVASPLQFHLFLDDNIYRCAWKLWWGLLNGTCHAWPSPHKWRPDETSQHPSTSISHKRARKEKHRCWHSSSPMLVPNNTVECWWQI